jgi:hypothetical protein
MCLLFRLAYVRVHVTAHSEHYEMQTYFHLNNKFDLLHARSDEVVQNNVIRKYSVLFDLCNNSV